MAVEAKGTGLGWALPLAPILVSVLVIGGACLLLITEEGPTLNRVQQRLVVELSESETEAEDAMTLTTRTRGASIETRSGLAAHRTSRLLGRSNAEHVDDSATRSVIPPPPERQTLDEPEEESSDVNVGEEELSPEQEAERRERAKTALLGIGEKLPRLRNVPGFQSLQRLQDEAKQERDDEMPEAPEASATPDDGAAPSGESREAQDPVQHDNVRVPTNMGGASGR